MEYGRILSESWELFRKNKILWLLGFIAAIGGGGQSGGQFSSSNVQLPSGGGQNTPVSPETVEQFEGLIQTVQNGNYSELLSEFAAIIGISVSLLLGFFVLAIVIGIGFWLAGLMARIGLVSAVARERQGKTIGWSELLADAVHYLWRVVGLKLLLYMPLLVVFFGFFGFFGLTFGSVLLTVLNSAGEMPSPSPILGMMPLLICGFVCLGIPILVALQITDGYAFRSIVFDEKPVLGSIKQGWKIGLDNIGTTIIMGIIFLVIGLIFAIVAAIVVVLPLAFLGVAAASSGGGFIISLVIAGIISLVVMAMVNSILVAIQSIAFSKIYQEITRGRGYADVDPSLV